MKPTLLVTAALCLSIACALGDTLTLWNFNNTNSLTSPPTAIGVGTASVVGVITPSFAAGASPDPGATNEAWNTYAYPTATNANLSAGVRFDVSTVGYENISLSWWQRNSATASRYLRVQYTLDGSTFSNADAVTVVIDSVFTNKTVNLSAIAGAANNPSFGFRLLTEFESTATGSGAGAYVATKDSSTYSSAGTMRFDLVTVSGTPLPDGNTPPYIFSSIGDQAVRPGESTGALSFTVLDAEDPARNLTLAKASSNPSVVPLANIVFVGSAAGRTVSVTGGAQTGASAITVYVIDTGGKSNSAAFNVTVLPANSAPTISTLNATNTLVNTPTPPLAFTIGDRETSATALSVSAMSANPTLVPNTSANLTFGGSGSNRTLTLTPAGGQTGIAPITVTVSDGTNLTSAAFALMVTPSTNVIFYEPFEYCDGSVLTNSAFLWDNRSGTFGQCLVTNCQLQLAAAQSEDIIGRLIGSPYSKGAGRVLYASFKANFRTLPKAAPGYFAHFASGSTLRGRVYAATTNAAPGCFRLLVSNASDTSAVPFPRDLNTNTTCTVVTRYDIDAATTTLWLDPTAESSPSVTASDPQTGASMSSFAFRQDADIGASLLIDDLKVGLSFAAVVSSGSPLVIHAVGGHSVVLSWSGPGTLQASPFVAGPYTNIPGATNPYTTPAIGSARFFRVQ